MKISLDDKIDVMDTVQSLSEKACAGCFVATFFQSPTIAGMLLAVGFLLTELLLKKRIRMLKEQKDES